MPFTPPLLSSPKVMLSKNGNIFIKMREYFSFAGHVVCITTINNSMSSSGFVVHLQEKLLCFRYPNFLGSFSVSNPNFWHPNGFLFTTTKRATNILSTNNTLRIFIKNIGRIQGYGLLALALVIHINFCLALMTHLYFLFFLKGHI
jgi:hypothetical protein